MQPRRDIPPILVALASRNHGLLTLAQLEEAGITRHVRSRLLDEGRLVRIRRGHYQIHQNHATKALAGLRVGGPGAAVGGWHALDLVGLRVPRDRVREPVTIWVPTRVNRAPMVGIRFRRDSSGRLTRTTSRRTIDPHDAVLDLCDAMNEQDALGFVLDAVRDGLVRPARLDALLAERTRHRHRRLIAGVLSDAAAGTHSVLEFRHVRDVERPHGLPVPQRQVRLGSGPVDAWYEEYGCVCQLDGWRYHRDRVESDHATDAELSSRGIVTLRFSWSDVVHHPCRTARRIAGTLQVRGWTGEMTRCPKCP